ncbi:alkaline phosphatase D family protein, partial [Corynebacterium evansiae]
PYNFDQWDGYAAERRRVIKYLVDNKIRNTVWLTGDIHSSWANDIPAKPGTYPNGGTAGVEIVCTSVTSSNIDDILKLPEDNALSHTVEYAFTNMNRHVKYLDFDSHGYTCWICAPTATKSPASPLPARPTTSPAPCWAPSSSAG